MTKTPDPDTGLDESPAEQVLQSLLAAYQLQARLTDRISLCGNWEEPEPEVPHAWFHLVESGVCIIRAPCLPEPLQLGAGDLIVFPNGAGHHLCSPADAGEAACTLLCGEFHFGGTLAAPLLKALPECIHVPAGPGEASLAGLASLLKREAASPRVGSRAVMNKLSDALFVIALRHHLHGSSSASGLLAALTDPRLAPALALIHAQPGEAWTVEALAGRVHLSRAAFAQRFAEVLGEPPMRYLTRWRMAQAALRLRDPRTSVGALAGELGFETEAAFRRAFKRIHGSAPGAIRRAAQPA